MSLRNAGLAMMHALAHFIDEILHEHGDRSASCHAFTGACHHGGGTCDIKMRPVEFFSEAGKKTARCDGAGGTSACVCDISKWTFDLFLIFIPKRQLPCAIIAFLASPQQVLGEWVMVG